MVGMTDFAYGLQMRDTIRQLVRNALDQERPKPRYARVVSFDRKTRKCNVIFTGEQNPVQVNMGSIQPKIAGQTVRVEGIGIDKYIADVMGEPYILTATVFPAILDPDWTSGLGRVMWEGSTTLSTEAYPFMAGYDPVPGAPVVLSWDGRRYIIQGVSELEAFPYERLLSLKSGWARYHESLWAPPQFTKNSAGVVTVSGLVKGGDITAGAVIATLPAGFRPPMNMLFYVCRFPDRVGRLDVRTNGDIIVQEADQGWVSLDGISFSTEPMASHVKPALDSASPAWANYHTDYGVPGYFRDKWGVVHTFGLLKNTAVPGADRRIWTYSAGDVPIALRPHYGTLVDTANRQAAGLDIKPGGLLEWKLQSGGVGYVNLTSARFAATGFSGQTIPLGYMNGWQRYSGDHAIFNAFRTPDGQVILSGLLSHNSGMPTNASVIGVLPVGCRPRYARVFSVMMGGGSARVDIDSAGNIICRSPNGTANWMTLDGITFMAEQ